MACTADGNHIAANILNDCVYLLDVDDLPQHSARQAAERAAAKHSGRRRRRRQADAAAAAAEVDSEACALQDVHQMAFVWNEDNALYYMQGQHGTCLQQLGPLLLGWATDVLCRSVCEAFSMADLRSGITCMCSSLLDGPVEGCRL